MEAAPPNVPPPVVQQSPEQPFQFDGKGGELFVLYLKGILLTVITLGIYSFWAKVDIRRYLFQKAHLCNRALNYHATGKEKFIAFLKGMVFIAIGVALLVGIGYAVFAVSGNPAVGVGVGYVLGLIVIIGLQPVIRVGKARYELSRTSWSNVRFRFVGRIAAMFAILLKGLLLSLITLGVYIPWFIRDLHAFYVNNTQLGNQPFSYDGEGTDLFLIYLKGILLSMITLGVYMAWMYAETQRFHVSHSSFQGRRFSSNLAGSDVFVTYLLSILLIICTLGFGIPWAINMWLRMEITCIRYLGEPDMTAIEGGLDEGADAFSDGLAEAGEALSALGDMLGG